MIRKHLTVTATTVEELDEETNKLQEAGWQKEGHARFCQEFALEEDDEAGRSFPFPPIDVSTFSKPTADLNAQLAELLKSAAESDSK